MLHTSSAVRSCCSVVLRVVELSGEGKAFSGGTVSTLISLDRSAYTCCGGNRVRLDKEVYLFVEEKEGFEASIEDMESKEKCYRRKSWQSRQDHRSKSCQRHQRVVEFVASRGALSFRPSHFARRPLMFKLLIGSAALPLPFATFFFLRCLIPLCPSFFNPT